MTDWADKLAGRFLVVDGPDGAGKSTQLQCLQDFLESQGLRVCRAIDPGGTPTGHHIRQILLHSKDLDISPVCETLLFMASRAQLLTEVIRPAIQAGQVVLCDRFISATLAYQGALGIDRQMILRLGEIAVENTWPDLTIVLDLDAHKGLARVGKSTSRIKQRAGAAPAGQMALFGDGDRLESRSGEYHEQVRNAFRALPDIYPRPVTLVDAGGDVDTVARRVREAIQTHLAAPQGDPS